MHKSKGTETYYSQIDIYMVQRTSTTHLAHADLLRAVSIATVVYCHLVLIAYPFSAPNRSAFIYLGNWGVNCFFVLSGLLISKPYLSALLHNEALPNIRLFYLRRFYRVYPLYFTTLVISIALLLLLTHHFPHVKEVVAHIFLVQTLSVKTIQTINGPMWTMGIDVAFYAVLPIVAIVFRVFVRGRSRRTIIQLLMLGIVSAASLCLIYRYVALLAHPDAMKEGAEDILMSFKVETVYVRNLFGFTFSFCLGISIAFLQVINMRIRNAIASACIVVGLMLAAIEAFSKAGLTVLVFTRLLPHRYYSTQSMTLLAHTLSDPLMACSSAAILFGLMNLQPQRFLSVSNSRLVTEFAAISYAVYLIHYPIILNIERYLVHGQLGAAAFFEYLIVGGFIIVPSAYGLHVLVEKPFLHRNDQLRASSTRSQMLAR